MQVASAPGAIQLRWKLAARDGAMACVYCDETLPPEKLTIDHVVPRSRGGSNRQTNMVLACYRCNHAKGDCLPHEWQPGRQWTNPRLNVTARTVRPPAQVVQARRARTSYAAFIDLRFCATCQQAVKVSTHPINHLLLDTSHHEPGPGQRRHEPE